MPQLTIQDSAQPADEGRSAISRRLNDYLSVRSAVGDHAQHTSNVHGDTHSATRYLIHRRTTIIDRLFPYGAYPINDLSLPFLPKASLTSPYIDDDAGRDYFACSTVDTVAHFRNKFSETALSTGKCAPSLSKQFPKDLYTNAS